MTTSYEYINIGFNKNADHFYVMQNTPSACSEDKSHSCQGVMRRAGSARILGGQRRSRGLTDYLLQSTPGNHTPFGGGYLTHPDMPIAFALYRFAF